MEHIEKIPVFIKYIHGRTVCICKQNRKLCGSTCCVRDVVERDKFRNWEDTYRIDKYGNWSGKNDQ